MASRGEAHLELNAFRRKHDCALVISGDSLEVSSLCGGAGSAGPCGFRPVWSRTGPRQHAPHVLLSDLWYLSPLPHTPRALAHLMLCVPQSQLLRQVCALHVPMGQMGSTSEPDKAPRRTQRHHVQLTLEGRRLQAPCSPLPLWVWPGVGDTAHLGLPAH